MSQNVLVEKLTMFKELHKLADKIKSRPEFTYVGKQRYRTENIPKVAETDNMFITGILYNCNPLYHLSFITDSTGNKMQGVHIESDFECMTDIEDYINKNFDFNTLNIYIHPTIKIFQHNLFYFFYITSASRQ